MSYDGDEEYADKPGYGFKHSDEHTATDEHADERLEADEGDEAVTEPAESSGLYRHEDEHEDEHEDRENAVTEPAKHEIEHEGTGTAPAEHEALTTESAEPEPWDAEPDEHEPPLAEPADSDPAASEPLLTSTSSEAFLDRWSDVQSTFIEDPQRSVTEADALLTEVLTAYQQAVEQRREQISSAWSGDSSDTEKMRLALLDYRDVITTMLPAHSDGGRAGAAA